MLHLAIANMSLEPREAKSQIARVRLGVAKVREDCSVATSGGR